MMMSGIGFGQRVALSAMQQGQVVDVVAVTFSHLPGIHFGTPLTMGEEPHFGAYDDPRHPPGSLPDMSQPMSAQEMQDKLSAHAHHVLQEGLEDTRATLHKALQEAMGPDAKLPHAVERLIDSDQWDQVPKDLRPAVKAYAGAAHSLEVLRQPPRLPDLDKLQEWHDSWVSRAVRDQVDAKLMVRRVELTMKREADLAKLALFDTGDGQMIKASRRLRAATDEVRLMGERKDMIQEMHDKIDRGEISVSVSTRSMWVNGQITAHPAHGHSVSVYASTRYHAASAAVAFGVQSSSVQASA